MKNEKASELQTTTTITKQMQKNLYISETLYKNAKPRDKWHMSSNAISDKRKFQLANQKTTEV